MNYFDTIVEDVKPSTNYSQTDWNGLVRPSKEQQEILDEIGKGKSIKIIANAGTGKTTLSLQIAKTFKDKKVLILTFNARNKDEGRRKVVKLSLSNTEYTGFDAFFQKITNENCQSGIDIKDIPLFKERFNQKVDILILDEAQDLTEKYYQEIITIINYNKDIQVVMVGDPLQAVSESFGSKNHDHRFFTLINKLLKIKFETKVLSLTYRHGQEVCDLVNRGTSAVTTPTTIKQFTYNSRQPWETYAQIRNEISDWEEGKSIYLAPAPKLFLTDLQYIKGAQELFYITDSRLAGTQQEYAYMKNKHCLISIHKSKGLEWENVLYFRKFHPNTLSKDREILDYVAKTRCIKKLVVINFPDRVPLLDNIPLTTTSLCSYINTDYASSVLSYTPRIALGKPLTIDFAIKYAVDDKEIVENEMLFYSAKIIDRAMQLLGTKVLGYSGLPDIEQWRKEQYLPKNKITRKWESFERDDISQILADYLSTSFTQFWTEIGVTSFVLNSLVSGCINFVSYTDKKVIKLKIGNSEFTIDDEIELALYKALLMKQHKDIDDFEFILYNPVTQQESKLNSPYSVCRDVLEKQVGFRLDPPIDDTQFIEQYEIGIK